MRPHAVPTIWGPSFCSYWPLHRWPLSYMVISDLGGYLLIFVCYLQNHGLFCSCCWDLSPPWPCCCLPSPPPASLSLAISLGHCHQEVSGTPTPPPLLGQLFLISGHLDTTSCISETLSSLLLPSLPHLPPIS